MLADNRLHLNPLLAIKRQAGFICLRLTPWHDVGSNFIDGKQIWLGWATRNQRRKTETNEGISSLLSERDGFHENEPKVSEGPRLIRNWLRP